MSQAPRKKNPENPRIPVVRIAMITEEDSSSEAAKRPSLAIVPFSARELKLVLDAQQSILAQGANFRDQVGGIEVPEGVLLLAKLAHEKFCEHGLVIQGFHD